MINPAVIRPCWVHVFVGPYQQWLICDRQSFLFALPEHVCIKAAYCSLLAQNNETWWTYRLLFWTSCTLQDEQLHSFNDQNQQLGQTKLRNWKTTFSKIFTRRLQWFIGRSCKALCWLNWHKYFHQIWHKKGFKKCFKVWTGFWLERGSIFKTFWSGQTFLHNAKCK